MMHKATTLKFRDLVDAESVQPLLDSFCRAVGVAAAIIDLDGDVIVGSNWQRICTDFHRKHPVACERCIESDTILANQMSKGDKKHFYRCRNGLTDGAAPIVLDGKHVANFFVGQFLLEKPDVALFKEQAATYDFDEGEYLKALGELPVLSREHLEPIISFLLRFAETTAEMALKERALKEKTEELGDALETSKAAYGTINSLVLDLKKTNEEMRRLTRAVEQSPATIVITNREGLIEYVNPTFTQLTGYTRSEAVGANPSVLKSGFHPPSFYANMWKTISDGMEWRGEVLNKDKNGELFWESATISPVRNDREEITHFIAVKEDITARKRVERALEIRLELNGAAGQMTTDELLTRFLDEAEELTNSKIGFFHLFDAKSEMLTLTAWSTNTLTHMCTAKGAGSHYELNKAGVWADAVRQGEPVIHNDYSNLSGKKGMPEGHAVVTREVVVPAKRDGRITAILGLGNKPTEYTQWDVDLLNQMCDWMLELLERKQAETELKEAIDNLARSNQELEQFAFIASHDLQEPLRKIISFGDLLKEEVNELDEKNPQIEDYMSRMQSAAGRMQMLIHNLLDFSRVFTKAIPFEAVDLVKSFRVTLDDHREKIEALNATVNMGSLPTIQANANQIHQLFDNLLGNSLKYSKQDVPPVIDVSGAIEEGHCKITIKDNGIGFEQQFAERIFAVFQRLHGRHDYEGTGIGLAICKKIVERHRGTIVAHGEYGKGANFTITLPVTQKKEQSDG